MKLFRTKIYREMLSGFNLPSVLLAKRTDNFEEKFKNNCTFGRYCCKYKLCRMIMTRTYVNM